MRSFCNSRVGKCRGLCLFKQDTCRFGDEPGDSSAFRGNVKIINFFLVGVKCPAHTWADACLEKCEIILFIMSKLSCVVAWNSR